MSDTTALDRQIGQLETAGRWNDALGLLWKRVAAVPDAAEKVRTLEHIVSVYRVKLNNEPEAIRATEQVLAVDATHAGAVAYLREAYTRRHETAKLQALEARVAQGGGGGLLGKVGNAFTAVGAGVSTAAAGVFDAVTSAPVAYEHPVEGAGKPPAAAAAHTANKCPYCRGDPKPGTRTCSACGASW